MVCIAKSAARIVAAKTAAYGALQGGTELYHATKKNESPLTKAKMAVIGAVAGTMMSPSYVITDLQDWYAERKARLKI